VVEIIRFDEWLRRELHTSRGLAFFFDVTSYHIDTLCHGQFFGRESRVQPPSLDNVFCNFIDYLVELL
jgi:hypothetical protein